MKKSVIILLFFVYSYANDSNLGSRGGNVFPFNSNHVKMVSENIEVIFLEDYAQVICEFIFENLTDSEEHVTMGFPKYSWHSASSDVEPISNFRTSINNMPEKVKEASQITKNVRYEEEVKKWYVWNYVFKPKERIKVVNTYNSKYGYYGFRTSGFSYIIGTGKTWEGKIGSGHFSFKFAPTFLKHNIINVSQGDSISCEISDDEIVCKFNEYEPEENEYFNIEFIDVDKLFHADESFFKLLSKENLRLLRNEFFARKGYLFNDENLLTYFSRAAWYQPKYGIKEIILTDKEKELIEIIKRVEARK